MEASELNSNEIINILNKQTLITLLFSIFTALLGVGIIIPVMPVFATDLGAGGIWLGLIIASFSLARGLFQPIVGNLSDKCGRKKFLLAGLFIYGVVGLCLPLATSIANLIVIRIMHGIGSAMIVPIAMAYMSSLAPKGQEGKYMSMLNIAIFTGIGCGPLIGGLFTDLINMASAFYAMSALSMIAFFLVNIYMPSQVEEQGGIKHIALRKVVKAMFKSRRTVGILLARLSTMVFIVPTMAFLPLFMVKEGLGAGIEIGIVMGGRTLVNAVLQVPCGKLADKYNKEIMLLIASLLTSIFVCLIPLANSFISLLCIFIIIGFGEAIIWPVLGAFATEEGRELYGHGSMMGLFNFAMSFGVLTGAMVSGIAMDTLGLDYAFYLSGFTVFLLTAFALIMIRTGSRLTE